MDLLDSDEEKTAEEQQEQSQDHSLVLTEPVPAEPVVLPHQQEDGQSLLQTIIMIIGGIILVILLVLFARWLYHKVHHNTGVNTSGTLQLPVESNSSNSQSGSSPQSSNPTNSGANSSNKPSSPSTNQNGKTLTNTGPGNVAVVFAASTLAAAGLHYIISLRRFNSRT